MRPRTAWRPALVALAATLTLAACDTADLGETPPTPDPIGTPNAPASEALTAEEAATVVAGALSLEGGGALDVAAGAIELVSLRGGRGDGFGRGCTEARTYDEATQTWTQTLACERGGAATDSVFARYGRTQTYRYFDAAGAAQREADGAAALEFAVVDAYGETRTPVLHHRLLDLQAAFRVDSLLTDLVTINGTYRRAATDTLRTRRGERTLTYTLDLAFDDVRGPRSRRGWELVAAGRAVEGQITGTLAGTATFTDADGQTRTRDFSQPIAITFGAEGRDRVGRLAIGRELFLLDLGPGQVRGGGRGVGLGRP